jgi:hypothetical protein
MTVLAAQFDLMPCADLSVLRAANIAAKIVHSWYLLTQVWDVVFKTRCKYVPVSSTAASVPPTVLKKTSRTWPHDGG